MTPTYKNYNEVPWYRRNGFNSTLVVVGAFLIPPLLWTTCGLLITGDIYENNFDKDGNLKKWSKLNKIAAWVVLVGQIGFMGWLLLN